MFADADEMGFAYMAEARGLRACFAQHQIGRVML